MQSLAHRRRRSLQEAQGEFPPIEEGEERGRKAKREEGLVKERLGKIRMEGIYL